MNTFEYFCNKNINDEVKKKDRSQTFAIFDLNHNNLHFLWFDWKPQRAAMTLELSFILTSS